jgi:hypothetical protein
MPRIFLGNFEFEHCLATPGRQLPAKLTRINAELAMAWLAIADDRDFIWTPVPVDPAFFHRANDDGLPRVIPLELLSEAPRGATCVPWGWTDEVRRLCDQYGWNRHDPPQDSVRASNSRRLSSSLERQWGVGLPGSCEADSVATIESQIRLQPAESRWVIKAEFGMSGRERLLGQGPLTADQRNWITRRLTADGVVFFEPWVDAVSEIGIQIDVPEQGQSTVVGVAPMIASKQGQYAGSRFDERANVDWDEPLRVALQAALQIQASGYFGPLGIDAMLYRDAAGEARWRPLQDINARWTMGRLSLGWRRLLKSGNTGVWMHGGDLADIPTEWTNPHRGWRSIATSPESIAGIPVARQSRVWIGD